MQPSIDKFQQRFSTMNSLLARWQTNLAHPVLKSLTEEFGAFADEYYAFMDSVGDDGKAYRMNRILNQLQEEWANINRACEQRQSQTFSHQLEQADTLATTYYNRFDDRYKDTPVPVVFFEKVFAITRYPFTPYALVSVPIQFYDDPTQWLAIAHELGHYIYWNSLELEHYQHVHQQLKQRVVAALQNGAKKTGVQSHWEHWVEETYADICGTLLAGVNFAISAQELALQLISPKVFLEPNESEPEDKRMVDEGLADHASMLIRPFVAIQTLQWLVEQGAAPQLVEKNWVSTLADRWQAVYQQVKRPIMVGGVPLDDLYNGLKRVVETILTQEWGISEKPVRQNEVALPRQLWSLFACQEWLNDLPDSNLISETPKSIVGRQAGKVNLAELPYGKRVGRLFDYFKSKTIEDALTEPQIDLDSKALEKLISADLGEDDFLADSACGHHNGHNYFYSKKVGTTWKCCQNCGC